MLQFVFFQKSHEIACYLPYKNEFDTKEIIDTIWQNNKNCYLPILREDQSLDFAHYKKGDALSLNRYGILEPQSPVQLITKEQLDLVLLPLIAFDREGRRLGAGGGYYDRSFAFVSAHPSQKTAFKKPWLIGVAFAQQETFHLPKDEWDILLDGILTEKECRMFK